MLITKIAEQTPLDKKEFHTDASGEIIEASELLYEVINHSYVHSGNCLDIQINNKNFDLQSLYWNCKEKIAEIEKGGDKTTFLALSVLEDTFKNALPLLLVNVEDIANGDMSQPNAVNRLREIFANSEEKKAWAKKAEMYKAVIENMGLTLEYSDYDNLSLIADPLLDAFTLYKGKEYRIAPVIMKVRDGERSNKRPVVMTTVCKYSSIKEFVDALMQCDEEAIISFGGVEQTMRQTKDYFCEYAKGYNEESISNYAKIKNLSEEEILNEVSVYTRAVYLGVKSKKCCYIMKMPFHTEQHGTISDSSCIYCYGKRAGYAPYQIFFNDIKSEPEGTTALATRHTGFRLNDIMDDQQKIWLPAFIEETREMFFGEEEVNAKWIHLPEEVYVKVGSTEIVPVFNNLPATNTSIFETKEPEELFAEEPEVLKLINRFKVTKEDIGDAPFMKNKLMTAEEIEEMLIARTRNAYEKVLAERIAEYLKCKWDTREKLVEYVFSNSEAIIERARTGHFNDFMEVIVDKEPRFDKTGKPIMTKTWKIGGYIEEQELGHTEIDDRKSYYKTFYKENLRNMCLWDGEQTASKPPVVVELRPWKAEHYAALLGCVVNELDEVLQLAEAFKYFHENNTKNVKSNFNTSDWVRYGRDRITTHMPRLADINVCMKKSVYKKVWKQQ